MFPLKEIMPGSSSNKSLPPSPAFDSAGTSSRQRTSTRRNKGNDNGMASTKNSCNIITHGNNNNKNLKSSEGWRRYGIDRRRRLLEEDVVDFHLNYDCKIEKYFELSEKIIEKFDDSFKKGADPEVAYVRGHRLCHFLVDALPRHPDYMNKGPNITQLREKSFRSLVRIKKRIEALALKIDEEQLNKYIMHDFDPFADYDEDDDDDSSSSSSSELERFTASLDNPSRNNPQWESFDGWSFDLPEKMSAKSAFSDTVDFSNQDGAFPSHRDLDASAETEDTSNETLSGSEHSFQAMDEFEPLYDSFGLNFLKRIASEAVRYDYDSEAEDSWAQSESESALYSTSSNLDQTYDPARIALQDLMKNKQKRDKPQKYSKSSTMTPLECDDYDSEEDSKENHSLDFDLSLETDDEEDEAAFDPVFPPQDPSERVSL